MPKLDLYKKHKAEYVEPRKPVFVIAAPAKYLAVSGTGAPGGVEFTAAIGALYAVAFTTKMRFKFAGRDYGVSKLECLWWGERKGDQVLIKHWQLIIRTPDFIKPVDVKRTQKELLAKGKPATVGTVKLIKLKEGRSVQMLHVGPYTDEARTIDAMKAFAAEHGFKFAGPHHEVYLSDPRRVPAARLKTILRQPVTRATR